MLRISVHRVGGLDGIEDRELLTLYLDEQLVDPRAIVAALARGFTELQDFVSSAPAAAPARKPS